MLVENRQEAPKERTKVSNQDLIEQLRNKGDELCVRAADEIEALSSKLCELGQAYDSMSKDLIGLYNENRKLKGLE